MATLAALDAALRAAATQTAAAEALLMSLGKPRPRPPKQNMTLEEAIAYSQAVLGDARSLLANVRQKNEDTLA